MAFDIKGRAWNWLTGRRAPGATLSDDFRSTYFSLRMLILLAGLGLPIGLLASHARLRVDWTCLGSMSASYWCMASEGAPDFPLRRWFVGCLGAIAIGLIAYREYTRWENRFLNAAGAAAIGVALCPMPWPTEDSCQGTNGHCGILLGDQSLHYIAAVIVFVMMGCSIVVGARATLNAQVQPRNGPRRPALTPGQRHFYTVAYAVLALAMLGSLLVAYALNNTVHALFWTEAVGIGAFSSYWGLKTYELRCASGIESRARREASSGLPAAQALAEVLPPPPAAPQLPVVIFENGLLTLVE